MHTFMLVQTSKHTHYLKLGEFISATAPLSPENTVPSSHPPPAGRRWYDTDLGLGTPQSSVLCTLTMTCASSSQTKAQHERGGGQRAPPPSEEVWSTDSS